MKKGLKVKLIIVLTGSICLLFLLGSIVTQNLPEKSVQKNKNEAAFNEISSYMLGSAYGSRGMYYKSQNDFLYYLDAMTGERSIVCTKTNCEHETGKQEGSLEKTDCEADFNNIESFIPYGNKLYYIPGNPVSENKPWEIWQQDLTGGNQKKVAEIDDKVNTCISIYSMQCNDLYMVVSFEEIGYYSKKGKYVEYDSFRTKAGIYIINMNDWSFRKVYLTRDERGNIFGKYARPYISLMSLGSKDVLLYCIYYDRRFDGKKLNKMPEKKQFNYLNKNVHVMQIRIGLMDGEKKTAVSCDGDHYFDFSGNWYMEQDYYGNFKAVKFRGDKENAICLYSSPESGEKEHDSGYRGIVVTEHSVFYKKYDKKRDVSDWYRYDRKTKTVNNLEKPQVAVSSDYSTKDYLYVTVFWSDDDYEPYAIPLKELENGTYRFPEKSEEKENTGKVE